jgi:hypothetical protein
VVVLIEDSSVAVCAALVVVVRSKVGNSDDRREILAHAFRQQGRHGRRWGLGGGKPMTMRRRLVMKTKTNTKTKVFWVSGGA